jgi:DNA-binding NarL/FixJ family response regulator
MIRVLVADDHPIVRSGIVALLEAAADVEVVGQASTGLEAVALAVEHEPDVVLMDLRMPELDGDQATARILEQRPGVKVIILTTYESDDSILSAIEAGASGYLLKAAPEDEILAGIRSVARGEVALAPSIAALLSGAWRPRPPRPSAPARPRCWPWSPRGSATRRSRPGCSSARQPSRPTCCTCSKSWA